MNTTGKPEATIHTMANYVTMRMLLKTNVQLNFATISPSTFFILVLFHTLND